MNAPVLADGGFNLGRHIASRRHPECDKGNGANGRRYHWCCYGKNPFKVRVSGQCHDARQNEANEISLTACPGLRIYPFGIKPRRFVG